MPKILVNNINLYYEIHGRGIPLIFITGFGIDHSIWNNIRETFYHNYQVILLDNRGAGQTDCPKKLFSIDTMADDVIALCKHLNIEKAIFIGNSLGGTIVQNIAYRYPNHTLAIVISNSFIRLDRKFFWIAAISYLLLSIGIPRRTLLKLAVAKIFAKKHLQKINSDKIADKLLEKMANIPTRNLLYQFIALYKFNSKPWIQSIVTPCLVIGTEKDLIAPYKKTKELASAIKNSVYQYFPNTGHLPHVEHPKLFSKVILDFFLKYT